MNDTEPLVSVLMTAYNREKYISEAIESVLRSSFVNFELIVVDDCSTDQTVEIVKDWVRKDSRIRLYVNQKNLGDYLNRNMAATYAKGKYIKYLDSDDTIYPWGLKAMVDSMEAYPEAGFGLMAANIDSDHPLPLCIKPEKIFLQFYFKGNLIAMGPTGSIIKTEAFRRVGGFSGKQYVGDTELWYAMGAQYPLVCMPAALVWWRQHEAQQIKSEYKNSEIRAVRYQVSKAPLEKADCPLSTEHKILALANIQNLYFRNILLEFSRGHFKLGFLLMKYFNISFIKLFSSLRRNRYPEHLDQISRIG